MGKPLQFRRTGRTWHACLDTSEALEGILSLDPALWAATAAPVRTLRADPAFLTLLDGDGDGRIRVDDVRREITWLLANHVRPDEIQAGNTTLTLARAPCWPPPSWSWTTRRRADPTVVAGPA